MDLEIIKGLVISLWLPLLVLSLFFLYLLLF
jgi:hypothetical protein